MSDESSGVGGLTVHPDATDREDCTKPGSVATNGLVEHDVE
jgi:hypothetical protein